MLEAAEESVFFFFLPVEVVVLELAPPRSPPKRLPTSMLDTSPDRRPVSALPDAPSVCFPRRFMNNGAAADNIEDAEAFVTPAAFAICVVVVLSFLPKRWEMIFAPSAISIDEVFALA